MPPSLVAITQVRHARFQSAAARRMFSSDTDCIPDLGCSGVMLCHFEAKMGPLWYALRTMSSLFATLFLCIGQEPLNRILGQGWHSPMIFR